MANTNLTTLFTSIADALREKGGTEDKIKASDFAEAITDLPSGGDFPWKIDYGEYEPLTDYKVEDTSTTTSNPLTFEHSLGVEPQIVIFMSLNPIRNVNSIFEYNTFLTKNGSNLDDYKSTAILLGNGSGGNMTSMVNNNVTWDTESFTLFAKYDTTTPLQRGYLRAGGTFQWIVIGGIE